MYRLPYAMITRILLISFVISGCEISHIKKEELGKERITSAEAFPSTYTPISALPVLIKNTTLLTVTGEQINNASILLRDGRISAMGSAVEPIIS